MVGFVLLAVGFAALFLRDSWGIEGLLALTWAAIWASVMGLVGFRSLCRAMAGDSSQLMAITMIGMLVRAGILAASQAVVFKLYGQDWGGRTLMATVSLYVLVLGLEVFTLHQALKAGAFRKPASDEAAAPLTKEEPTNEGSAGE